MSLAPAQRHPVDGEPRFEDSASISQSGWGRQDCTRCDGYRAMSVSRDTSRYHCFKCGWSNRVIKGIEPTETVAVHRRYLKTYYDLVAPSLQVIDQELFEAAIEIAVGDGRTTDLPFAAHTDSGGIDDRLGRSASQVWYGTNRLVDAGVLHRRDRGSDGTSGPMRGTRVDIVARSSVLAEMKRIYKANRKNNKTRTFSNDALMGNATCLMDALNASGDVNSKNTSSPLASDADIGYVIGPTDALPAFCPRSDCRGEQLTRTHAAVHAVFTISGASREYWLSLSARCAAGSLIEVFAQPDGTVLRPHPFFYCRWGDDCVQKSCQVMTAKFAAKKVAAAAADEARAQGGIDADRDRERLEAVAHARASRKAGMLAWMSAPESAHSKYCHCRACIA